MTTTTAEDAASSVPDYPSAGALTTLFVLALRQNLRGRRPLVLSLLFLLPSLLIAGAALANVNAAIASQLEFNFILTLIPHLLAPLTALLYAAGVIQDEVEEQTLTYLLLRPLPRFALYVVKLLPTLLVTCGLTTVFTLLAYLTLWLVAGPPPGASPAVRALQTSGLLALSQVGYCGVFGFIGLLTRRSLIAGVVYLFAVEGLLASFDTLLRQLTVMYYFRVLALRWLDPPRAEDWSISLERAPTATTCVLVLVGVGVVLTILGALLIGRREFRMKTPEGS